MLRGKRKELTGTVVSRKMDKTAVVLVEYWEVHPLYAKRIRRTRKVKAHDEKNETQVGDVVLLSETRPLSKEKQWRVVRILEKRSPALVEPVGGEEK